MNFILYIYFLFTYRLFYFCPCFCNYIELFSGSGSVFFFFSHDFFIVGYGVSWSQLRQSQHDASSWRQQGATHAPRDALRRRVALASSLLGARWLIHRTSHYLRYVRNFPRTCLTHFILFWWPAFRCGANLTFMSVKYIYLKTVF